MLKVNKFKKYTFQVQVSVYTFKHRMSIVYVRNSYFLFLSSVRSETFWGIM